MSWDGTDICHISVFCIKVLLLLGPLFPITGGFWAERGSATWLGQSRKPGQVAAHGTWCPASAARHVNRNCLAATS